MAAKIGLFEDSFVQNTLNVGSNNSGGISAANITLAGGTNNPYISIGQSSTAGNQGYDVDGIFIGNHDNSGTPSYRLSLKGGSNHLKWNGSTLDIKGAITLTSGQGLEASLGELNTATGSLNTAVTNAQGGVDSINATTGGLENPSSYAFGGNGFTLATNTATAGLNLTSQYMGYHDGSDFTTYMDSGGDFYLGGTSGALTWDASEAKLTVTGTINITGGQTANQLNSLNSATGSLNSSVSSLNTATGSLNTAVSNAQSGVNAINATTGGLENPTSYAFGGSGANAFALATNTAAAGLNLTSQFVGYHDGSNFTTYMANNGDFFLGGTGGALTWDASADELIVNGSGTFTGTLSGGSVIGGTLSVPTEGNPKFHVDSDGNMSAQDANISGSFNIQSGILGSWVVDTVENEGKLRDVDSRIILNPTSKKIQLFNSSNELKAQINADDTLTSAGAGNIYIASYNSNQPGSSIPATSYVSSNSGTGAQGEATAFSTPDSTDITISTTGEYQLSDLYVPS